MANISPIFTLFSYIFVSIYMTENAPNVFVRHEGYTQLIYLCVKE